jgi:transcription initiation factor TFIIIB Brf1 subunit/transcription initiation factor TFIIB
MERLEQIERCRECRGHVVRSGDEYVCTTCGRVDRRVEEEKYHLEFHIQAPSQLSDTRLGSYIGDRSDKDSKAYFNGVSTIGFAKVVSDNLGVDGTEQKCKAMIRRVGDRLALPAFVQQNAMALTEKVLAEGSGSGRRIYVAAASAYSILSAARAAGMDHISSGAIMEAFNDMGHKVTKKAFLQMGLRSSVPLRPTDPTALLRSLLNRLEADETVQKRLKKKGVEPGPYYRRLFQASQTVLAALRDKSEGRNPRTIAAGSVYIASKEAAPGVVTQKVLAQIAGVAEYTVREFCASAAKESGPLNEGPS